MTTCWFRPLGDPGEDRDVHPDDLAAVYDSPEAGPESAFRCATATAAVIVFLVGDAHCLVMLRSGGTDEFLVEPGNDDTSVPLSGVRTAVPAGAVVPRRRGLEALQGVDDPERLRAAHSWRAVPCWLHDPLHERLGDVVEALIDRAYAAPPDAPAALLHVKHLMLFHNEAQANGFSPELAEDAALGADHLDLPDLAAVIREIHADEDIDWRRLHERYQACSGPFGDDAGLIRAAVARRFDTFPGEFGADDRMSQP
ncbi:hypothetical protein [Dactylosporangium sp. NPDC006015]|uniref:hypothetical protein n=1 Tax=Dactylosporangium sp. NPDC006015 TaxID=3154576 RepID=UPI0033A360CF